MSKKIIDPMGLAGLIKKEADPIARRLLEARMEQEAADDAKEASAKGLTAGPPPNAQIVFSAASGRFGVAIRGAQRVCELPKEYAGPALELNLMPGNRYVVTHPNHSPLLIDPDRGTTRRL